MNTFALTKHSMAALVGALQTSMAIKLELAAPSVVAWATLCTEHAGAQLEAVITHGHRTSSLTLYAHNEGNAKQLAGFIEAVVNDTIETSQITPARPIGSPGILVEPRHALAQELAVAINDRTDSALCVTDINSLSVVCQRGGACGLLMGALLIVHCTSHSGRTALASFNGVTYSASGSARDVASSMREHIDQLRAA